MNRASDLIKLGPRQKALPKTGKFFELSQDRAEWLETFAAKKGISQLEVIQTAIDELRRLEQEYAEAA